jgi:hypothetical protein
MRKNQRRAISPLHLACKSSFESGPILSGDREEASLEAHRQDGLTILLMAKSASTSVDVNHFYQEREASQMSMTVHQRLWPRIPPSMTVHQRFWPGFAHPSRPSWRPHLSSPPVTVCILAQKRRSCHAHVGLHPARGIQLTHGGVHNRKSCFALFPSGNDSRLVGVPLLGVVMLANRSPLAHSWEEEKLCSRCALGH